MKILTKQQIILLHSQLISEFGGLDGIRDEGVLESSINTPFQSFDGHDLYTTIFEKATRLCFGLINNHPFIDGNKRIATHSMLVFLDINHISLNYNNQDLISVILSVATGKLNELDLLTWLLEHII